MRPIQLVPVALLLLAACATGGRDPRPVNEARVTVVNNLIPRSGLVVRLVTGTGSRKLLGSVAAGATVSFHVRERSFAGPYRLVAATDDGRELGSPGFALFWGAEARWRVDRNLVTVEEEGALSAPGLPPPSPSGR